MPSDSDDNRLLTSGHSVFLEESPHLKGGLDAVHLRHVEVGEDDFVADVHVDRELKLLNCLTTCDTVVNLTASVYASLQNDRSHCSDAKLFIVNDHYPVLFIILQEYQLLDKRKSLILTN